MQNQGDERYNELSMTHVMSTEFVLRAIQNALEDEKCDQMHSFSCNRKAFMQTSSSVRSVSKLYFIVHLIPLLLKHQRVAKNPKEHLRKFAIGYIKSLMFAGVSLFLIRRIMCLFTQYYAFTNSSAIWAGFVCGLGLLLESGGRQAEISLFAVNKGVQMLYNLALRRKIPVRVGMGQCWLNAISVAILCYAYLDDRQLFREGYRRVLDLILDKI